jgi:hypothetical protein
MMLRSVLKEIASLLAGLVCMLALMLVCGAAVAGSVWLLFWFH